jgi:LCP family protein required for cell wall assembly
VNLLLLGTDDRVKPNGEVDRGRSDSVMVLCLNPQLKRAVMLSLPRDLLVTIPEVPKGVQSYPQKLNHAYAFGGVDLSDKTIGREIGIPFDYHAKVSLEDFVKVVDMLGGVEVNVPDYEGHGRGMNYDDNWGNLHVHLKPGYQHLNGRQAQGFVRYRKSDYHNTKGGLYGITDTERGGNQQIFLKAMIEQHAHVSNLPNLMRAAAFTMQHLDTNMDWRTMVGLAMTARKLDTNHLLHLVPPVADKMINSIYYCVPLPGKMEEMRQRIDAYLAGASDEPVTGDMPFLKKEMGPGPPQAAGSAVPGVPAAAPVAPAVPVRVRVLNGSGGPGAAKLAASRIKGNHVRLDPVGNADRSDYSATIIKYAPGQQAAAQWLATALGLPEAQLQQVAADPALPGVDVTMVVGQDFLRVAPPTTPTTKPAKAGRVKRH